MDNEKIQKIKESLFRSAKSLYFSLPILLGVILLIGLANTFIPKEAYSSIFSNISALDAFIGAAIGSVLAGNPITSYIMGGEFLAQGVGLFAVTSFLVAWVTVGIVQLPAESLLLGKRFAIWRNLTSFVFAIIVSVITVMIVGLI